MRVLCNLPLECFDQRAAMRDVELVTFGPPHRMQVDGVHFPFDVAFDPSRGSWQELAAALPQGFVPDVLLLYWPDQEPMPADLANCPWRTVGVISDYNLALPYLVGLWPFFDVLLCDRAGQELFTALSFAQVQYWCQYAPKRRFHHLDPAAGPRTIDLGFAGNMNPAVQQDRATWLPRLAQLRECGVRVALRSDVRGSEYGRFLNQCAIGWNRSIRGEANLRSFEVPACGALLLQERENLEIREFFVPDEECVLYGDDDFEAVVQSLLGDRARLQRIAAAGHRRVAEHHLGQRIGQLVQLLGQPGPGRPPATAADALLGRALAMLPTWAESTAVVHAALAAVQAMPEDPRALNLLAIANLRLQGQAGAEAAQRLWSRAATIAPSYLPALANLANLAEAAGHLAAAQPLRARLQQLQPHAQWADVDGPTLPLGYSAPAVKRSLALQAAVRNRRSDQFAAALV